MTRWTLFIINGLSHPSQDPTELFLIVLTCIKRSLCTRKWFEDIKYNKKWQICLCKLFPGKFKISRTPSRINKRGTSSFTIYLYLFFCVNANNLIINIVRRVLLSLSSLWANCTKTHCYFLLHKRVSSWELNYTIPVGDHLIQVDFIQGLRRNYNEMWRGSSSLYSCLERR